MANIKDEALLIVFQDDIQYKVRFDSFKENTVGLAWQKTSTYNGLAGTIIPGETVVYDRSTGLLEVPLAKRADAANTKQGIPGLMFPGIGLSYNELTGELTRDFETSLTFAGLIGYNTSENHVIGPALTDETGYFYIVADATFTRLNDNWGSSSDQLVNVGDKVVRKYDGDWAIVPDVSGSLSVFEVISGTDALIVNNSSPQFPVLTIDNARPSDVISFNPPAINPGAGLDGLMSEFDKAKLDNLGVLLDEPFISSITPLEPIITTETQSGLGGRLVDVVINITNATSTERGVVKITDNSSVEELIEFGTSTDVDTLNTLSALQAEKYYLPSDFRFLTTIASI